MNSTLNLYKHNLQFFLLVTHSLAGGLPLCNFIAFHMSISIERKKIELSSIQFSLKSVLKKAVLRFFLQQGLLVEKSASILVYYT